MTVRHIVLPGLTVLEKLIATARADTEERLFQKIAARVSEGAKERILSLLQKPPDQRFSPFQQLQQAAGRPSPDAFDKELDALEKVTAILPETVDLSDLAPTLLERFAATISGLRSNRTSATATDALWERSWFRGAMLAMSKYKLCGIRDAKLE